MKWRQIKTAPMGVDILLYDPQLNHPIIVGNGYKYDDGTVCFSDAVDNYPYEATHWMPLPKKPEVNV